MRTERVRRPRCGTTARKIMKVREAACKVQDALQQSVAVEAQGVRITHASARPPDDVGRQHWGKCGQTAASRLSGTARLRLLVPPQTRRALPADPGGSPAEPRTHARRTQRLLSAACRCPASVAAPYGHRHGHRANPPRCLIQINKEGTW